MAMTPLSLKVDQTIQQTEKSLAQESVVNYEMLSQAIGSLDTLAREIFQKAIQPRAKAILDKLENEKPLSTEELELVELLVVGEAKYYLKYENDFENWKQELKRLTEEMRRLQSREFQTVDDILHMRALSRDARNVVNSITFYLREKERIDNFGSTLKSGIIPLETGRVLAGLIRAMLQSSEM